MKNVLSVSKVNTYVKGLFRSDYVLNNIYIQGEVTNCRYQKTSGHVYFSLKDEKSILSCVIFLGNRAKGLRFKLEDGQLVVARGNITLYERDGKYQLNTTEITLAGAGLLHQQYEKLKRELFQLGYFDEDRKKPLPFYPKKIGIVTSMVGAAIEDMKSTAARRNPFVQLYLYPANVQGVGAAESIAKGIEFFDGFGVDVIIIGRGGGSREELWAFNERCVADAIYKAQTPLIAATGHEIDLTIADYCADLRVETPTAACGRAIPDIRSILETLNRFQEDLDGAMQGHLQNYRNQLAIYQRLLETNHPGNKVKEQKQALSYMEEKLHNLMKQKLMLARNKADFYAQALTGLSPSMRLRGGYVFAQKDDASPVSSVKQLQENEEFKIILQDGKIRVRTLEIEEENRG